MAHQIFGEIVNTNAVALVAMDDSPMSFLLRINGNIRPLRELFWLLEKHDWRRLRWPTTDLRASSFFAVRDIDRPGAGNRTGQCV